MSTTLDALYAAYIATESIPVAAAQDAQQQRELRSRSIESNSTAVSERERSWRNDDAQARQKLTDAVAARDEHFRSLVREAQSVGSLPRGNSPSGGAPNFGEVEAGIRSVAKLIQNRSRFASHLEMLRAQLEHERSLASARSRDLLTWGIAAVGIVGAGILGKSVLGLTIAVIAAAVVAFRFSRPNSKLILLNSLKRPQLLNDSRLRAGFGLSIGGGVLVASAALMMALIAPGGGIPTNTLANMFAVVAFVLGLASVVVGVRRYLGK